MAVFLVPVAGGVVGAGYLLGLTKAYTSSANFCAKKLSGEVKGDTPFPKNCTRTSDFHHFHSYGVGGRKLMISYFV